MASATNLQQRIVRADTPTLPQTPYEQPSAEVALEQ